MAALGKTTGSWMPPGGVRASRQRGFSLLEVLVAFVVLALVGTALFRLFGGAMGNAGAAEEWSRAVLVAQTRLEVAAAADPLREGTDAGTEDDGRIRWESKVSLYEPQDGSLAGTPAIDTMATRLYRIEVAVHLPGEPGKDRAVMLQTMRLAGRAPK